MLLKILCVVTSPRALLPAQDMTRWARVLGQSVSSRKCKPSL